MGFIWPTQRFRGSSKEDLTPPLGSLHGFKHGFSETRFARVLVVSNPHRFGVYCKCIVWFKRGSGLLSPGDGNFTTNIKQGGLRRRAQFTHGDTVFLGVMFQMTVLKGFKVGVGIVKRALSYPVKLIAKNPGVNGSVLSDKVFSFNDQNWIY